MVPSTPEHRLERLERRLRHTNVLLGALVAALVAVVPVALSAVSVPHAFSNGTVADAAQVNANFDALENALGAAQPFVHSKNVDVATGVTYSSSAWTTVAQATDTVTLPAGRVFVTWHLSCYSPSGSARMHVRPFVGASTPATGQTVFTNEAGSHKSYSGSWSTTTAGGTMNVGLSMSVSMGSCVLNSDDHVAWTIVVFPNP